MAEDILPLFNAWGIRLSTNTSGGSSSGSPSLLFRTDCLASLEAAAAAFARLDLALISHPLTTAWLYRARLEAVRREAAVDGELIDPWHLAALIEGVRFRMPGETILDRGMIFAAARYALDLYRWRVRPGEARQREIARAAAHLQEVAAPHSPSSGRRPAYIPGSSTAVRADQCARPSAITGSNAA